MGKPEEIILPDGRVLHWLTTAPHPGIIQGWKKSHTHGADCGQVGWRLHAVALSPADWTKHNKKEAGYRRPPALCGCTPAHGWSLDLFIDDECARCQKAMERLSPSDISREGNADG